MDERTFGEELMAFGKKCHRYAKNWGYRHLANDFASWAVLQKTQNPTRSFRVKSLFIDYLRHELGDSRRDVKEQKRKAINLYYDIKGRQQNSIEITEHEHYELLTDMLSIEEKITERERVCLFLVLWLGFEQSEVAIVIGSTPLGVSEIISDAIHKINGAV
jgi:DNA-directed RNA polymerase specialized sigma24 family protein